MLLLKRKMVVHERKCKKPKFTKRKESFEEIYMPKPEFEL